MQNNNARLRQKWTCLCGLHLEVGSSEVPLELWWWSDMCLHQRLTTSHATASIYCLKNKQPPMIMQNLDKIRYRCYLHIGNLNSVNLTGHGYQKVLLPKEIEVKMVTLLYSNAWNGNISWNKTGLLLSNCNAPNMHNKNHFAQLRNTTL